MFDQPSAKNIKPWLSLSEAAERLGVHFTTLRRWADAGDIECIRTPGGRRRFQAEVIERFIIERKQAPKRNLPAVIEMRLIDHTRQDLKALNPVTETWMAKLSEEQRFQFRQAGHHLTALLMQYSSRGANGDAFLEEGRRIAVDYGRTCRQVGLSITQAVQAFLFFQRSILDAVHETGFLDNVNDAESRKLYQKVSFFFDEALLALVGQYYLATSSDLLSHS